MKIILKIIRIEIEIESIEINAKDEVAEPITAAQTTLDDSLWDAYNEGHKDGRSDEVYEREDKLFDSTLKQASQRSDTGKHHRCARCNTLARRRLNGREGCHDCDGWDEATVLRFRTFADSRERWS